MAPGDYDFTERNLSYSQLTEWMSCPHRHKLSYLEGYRPVSDGVPLLFGSFFHETIAGIILEGDGNASLAEAVIGALDGVDSEISRELIVSTADQAYQVALRADKWLGISEGNWRTIQLDGEPLVEKKLDIPVPGWQAYVGIADWVAENLINGKTYLIDWKTRGRLNDPKKEELNLQLMSYTYMLQELGVSVDSAAIVQVLSQLPVVPKLNKNGTMSRQKIQSDWATYEEALIENDLDPAEYQDMRSKLDTQFFDFVELYFSDGEVTNAWNEIVLPTADNIRNDIERVRYMSPWNCRNCPFKAPCLEGLRGYDPTDTLEYYFQRRD